MKKRKLNIDVSSWGLPKLTAKIEKLQKKYEKKVEGLLDGVFHDFDYEYGSLAIAVKEAASEVLNISLEDEGQIDLFQKPGKLLFSLNFYDQYPEWEVDIEGHILETINGCVCEDTSYIDVRYETKFKKLSKKLKTWAEMIDENIDPEGK